MYQSYFEVKCLFWILEETNVIVAKRSVYIKISDFFLVCEEWGRSVFQEVDSPSLLSGSSKINRSLCGAENGTPYIIGGIRAVESEFPHMVD